MSKINPLENHELTIKNYQLNTFKFTFLLNILITISGGTFIVGWHIGLFNTPSEIIREFVNQTYTKRYNKYISDDKLTLIWSLSNGLLPLGGSFGGLITGIVVENFGPKKSMILINMIAIISSICYLVSKKIESYEILILARFLTGFLCGFFCGVCPLYLSELSPIKLRGFFGTLNALAICIGNLVANIFGLPQILGTLNLLPYLLGCVPLVLSIIHLTGLPFCVESPKFLFITKNKENEGRKSIERIQKDINNIDFEMNQLKMEKDYISTQKKSSYLDLVRVKTLRKALLVSIILQASQQFSGIIAVITYSTRIFTSVGLNPKTWAIYASIFLSTIETICHFFCMFVIDITGRRVLILVGLTSMSLCCFILGLIQILIINQLWLKILAVVVVTIYIIFYSFGPGPIPLLVTAELFDTEYRGKATSIAVFLNWLFNFFVSVSFPYIEKALGGYGFIIYGILLILFAIFTYFKCPETKNKNMQEILNYFK